MQTRLGKIHDVREELGRDPTAVASLTVIPAGRKVAAHVHTNPYLALHVLGSYRDSADQGVAPVSGPAAVFFPAGSTHEMAIGDAGLATVIIEFDPDALHRSVGGTGELRSRRLWLGGEVGRHARRLAHGWLSGASAEQQFICTTAFLKSTLATAPLDGAPRWLDELETLVDEEFLTPDVERWATTFGVSRSWLLRAYRHWRGEGLGERLRRRRVEAAAALLESSDRQLAEIALETGFCDQSHMNRAFKKCIGRTPAIARAAQLGFSVQHSPSATGRNALHR